jgi:hypothetical protein
MGVTILLESAAAYLRDGLVGIPISDASERIQTFAAWVDDRQARSAPSLLKFPRQSPE